MSETKAKYLYEGMFLLNSNQYASDSEGTVAEVIKILEKAGASITAHRPWQEGRLAYEIENQRKGLHYIVLFEMPGDGVKKVTRAVKLSNLILRHLIIRHTPTLFQATVAALSGEQSSETPEGETAKTTENTEAAKETAATE